MTPAESMLLGLLKIRGSVRMGRVDCSRGGTWSLVHQNLHVLSGDVFYFDDTEYVCFRDASSLEDAVVVAQRIAKELGVVYVLGGYSAETVLAALLNDGETDDSR